MTPFAWILIGIVTAITAGALAFLCGVIYQATVQMGALAVAFNEMAQSSNRLANNMYGMVPAMKRLGENLEKHVTHMGGLVAVIESANEGKPPPVPTEPENPAEANYTASMPPQVDWENPDGNGQAS